jgi:hypothetical protein
MMRPFLLARFFVGTNPGSEEAPHLKLVEFDELRIYV